MARLGYSEVFVRKPLAVAMFSASVAIGIAVGCSAPSPDGTGLNRGRGSSSGDSGNDPTETASSSGAAPSCTNHEKVDDRPACDQCAREKCCAEVVDCDKTPDCQALLKCIDDCKGDVFCGLTCDNAHPKGSEALSSVAGCAQTKCESECPSSGLDAGFDFDAF